MADTGSTTQSPQGGQDDDAVTSGKPTNQGVSTPEPAEGDDGTPGPEEGSPRG